MVTLTLVSSRKVASRGGAWLASPLKLSVRLGAANQASEAFGTGLRAWKYRWVPRLLPEPEVAPSSGKWYQ